VRLGPAGSPVADAVAQIGAACAAVRRAAGVSVSASVAEMVVVCSGGWLLGSRPPALGGRAINTGPHL